MGDNKLLKMFQFMSEIKLQTLEKIDNDLKCIICDNVLISACQGLCGCSYCQACVDVRIKSDKNFCPGSSDECKAENLSNNSHIQVDHKSNKKIARLNVKCPESACSYQCELIDMADHYRLCCHRNVKCQFHELGCDSSVWDCQKTIEHNRLLLDFVGNLKNEICHLKQCQNDMLRAAELMKKNVSENNEKLDGFSAVFQSLQSENLQLKAELQNLRKGFTDKIDSVALRIDNLKMTAKADRESLTNEFKQHLEKQNIEIKRNPQSSQSHFDKFRQEINNKIAREMGGIRELVTKNESKTAEVQRQLNNLQLLINTQSVQFEAKLNQAATLSTKIPPKPAPLLIWDIDRLCAKRSVGTNITSEYFSPAGTSYQMQLALYPDGYGDAQGTSLTIYVYVWVNNELRWPFCGTVTITVTNQYTKNAGRTIEKYCRINKPLLYSWSQPFNFKYDILSSEGLLKADSLSISCCIAIN